MKEVVTKECVSLIEAADGRRTCRRSCCRRQEQVFIRGRMCYRIAYKRTFSDNGFWCSGRDLTGNNRY
jgi:hypothetical protein